jgi:hypothetical protein
MRFSDAVNQLTLTERVRVHVDGNEGNHYEGVVTELYPQNRHFILGDAIDCETGESVGDVVIYHADEIIRLDAPPVEIVDVAQLERSPYQTREFDRSENAQYLEQIRTRGSLGSLPAVYEVEPDTYRVIDGNKGLWVLTETRIQSHPVRVLDIEPEEALARFAYEHYPTGWYEPSTGAPPGGDALTGGQTDTTDGIPHCPTPVAPPEPRVVDDGKLAGDPLKTSIERVVADWGSDALELYPIAYNATLLGLTPNDD